MFGYLNALKHIFKVMCVHVENFKNTKKKSNEPNL